MAFYSGTPLNGTLVVSANEFADKTAAVIVALQEEGYTTQQSITDELNRRQMPTAKGGQWHKTSVCGIFAATDRKIETMSDFKGIQGIIDSVVLNKEDIAYTHPVFMQCFMPISRHSLKKLKNPDFHSVQHGRVSLAVEAGRMIDPDQPQVWEKRELPTGGKARLLLTYINDQAICTKEPVVNMGESMREFMRMNGVPISGQNGKELQEQVKNIGAATILLGVWNETSEGKHATQSQAKISKDISFWVEKDPSQLGLWQPTFTLSDDYMKALTERRPTPISFPALATLQGTPRAMDIFCWLVYRLHSVKYPTKIPYEALHPIFGNGIKELKSFKWNFKKAIELIIEKRVYPDALFVLEKDYFTLHPSPPLIPAKETRNRSRPLLPRRRK